MDVVIIPSAQVPIASAVASVCAAPMMVGGVAGNE
jgi:hypothetical protein